MTLLIDSREPQEYKDRGDFIVTARYGDAIIEHEGRRIVTERKTPTDMVSSLRSGRLNEQMAGVDILFIMIDTTFLPRGVFDMLYRDDTLRTICNGLCRHHTIQYATGIDDYFSILRLIEKQVKAGSYQVLTVRCTVDHNLDDTRLGPLIGIPGISHIIAKRILDKYSSLVNSFMNVSKWPDDVEGIGPKKHREIIEFLNAK